MDSNLALSPYYRIGNNIQFKQHNIISLENITKSIL